MPEKSKSEVSSDVSKYSTFVLEDVSVYISATIEDTDALAKCSWHGHGKIAQDGRTT